MEWIGGVDGKEVNGTGVRQGSGVRCVKGGMDGRMDGKGVGQGCVNGGDKKTGKMGKDMGVMCEKRGRWMNGWVEVDEWMGGGDGKDG